MYRNKHVSISCYYFKHSTNTLLMGTKTYIFTQKLYKIIGEGGSEVMQGMQ